MTSNDHIFDQPRQKSKKIWESGSLRGGIYKNSHLLLTGSKNTITIVAIKIKDLAISNPTMKLNLLMLSVAALVNGATANTKAVEIGTAGNYVILAKSGISTVPSSAITGDIGVSPIAATDIFGFDLVMPSEGHFSEASQVTGKVFAANYGGVTPTLLTAAVSDMQTAYAAAAGRGADANVNGGQTFNELKKGDISGETLTPGVYTFTPDIIINADIYLDGTDEDVFILRTAGSLLLAAKKCVILSGGAQAKNIFWQVAGQVIVGTGAHLEGVLLVKTAVVFNTGASLNGRILTQTACTLQMATITEPPMEPVE